MKALDHWMFREYAPATGGLPLYRIVFAILLLVFAVPAPTLFATLPASFYAPQLGLGVLFAAFPPRWFCEGLNFLLVLGTVCLLFGYRVRMVSVLLAVGYVVLKSFAYAIGKVNGDILIPLTLFCLAWSAWGGRYSMDAVRAGVSPRRESPAWPVCLLMFVTGLCFFTAFYSKAKGGWLDWRLETCHGQLLLNYLGAERPCLLADAMFKVHSHVFWKGADYSTVLLEGAVLFCAVRLLAMRLVLASAAIFHGFIFFSMNIFFAANVMSYLCLLDGRMVLRYRAVRRVVRGWMRLVRVLRLWQLVLLAVGVYLLEAGVGYQWRDSGVFLSFAAVITLGVGVGCVGWCFWRVVSLMRGRMQPLRRPL